LRAELPSLLSDTPPVAAVDAQVQELLRTLTAGDLAGARALVRRRLDAGVLPHDLVPGLLLAAMAAIGSRWEQDALSIFEEHLATETLVRLLAELPAMAPPAQGIGRSALVTGVPDDHIQLAPMALSIYLELRGWTPRSLGHGLPAAQIGAAAAALRPDAVFLSLSMVARVAGAVEAVEYLARAPHRPPVIVGGRGALLAQALLEARGARVAESFDRAHRLALDSGGGDA
jgi:methanogenic corrinoid protein MtbC1